ncbi:PQQ-binding-like beta-propeller repeat protein, partial [Actinotalea ferrariae]|uniref:outer membrane protein assembly factor BamB family protein n=1 Tax=Actinotalea ferrariae TaxID=1386098 RepID=UPI001C8C5EE6
ALVAAAADVRGVVPSLREPPQDRAGWPGDPTGDVVLPDGLTVGPRSVDGALRTVALERDGTTRWTAPPQVDTAGRGSACSAASDPALVLCFVPGEPGVAAPTTDAELGGTSDRLVVLGTADGAVVAEHDLGSGGIGWAVLGDDVVIARRVGSEARLSRTDVLGAEVWTRAVPLPAWVLARHLRLTVRDDLVVLTGPAAAVVDPDGAVLGTWTAPGERRLSVDVQTSSVGFAVWTTPEVGTWFTRTGAAGARLVGVPLRPAVDDRSAPQVVLLQDGWTLRALDVVSGELWQRRVPQSAPARLDGVVVLDEGEVLTAVDVASGAELWSRPVGPCWDPGAVVTDGVRLAVPADDARCEQVTALGLHDGAEVWRAVVPPVASDAASPAAPDALRTGARS